MKTGLASPRPRHVLIRAAEIEEFRGPAGTIRSAGFLSRDDGDLVAVGRDGPHLARIVSMTPGEEPRPDIEPESELVLFVPPLGTPVQAESVIGLIGHGQERECVDVTVEPIDADVFDRLRGIFESSALKVRCVLIVGCGSGGSFVLRELVRSGIGRFVLIDHDRLEIENVCRHELGLRDLGRLKVNALRDYIYEHNPQAAVTTAAFKLDGTTLDSLRGLISDTSPDLIICGTDNRESRLLVNRAALLADVVALYGGVRRRAYAGQILRVIPGLTACYQCFIHQLPEAVLDPEISSERDARRTAYSDVPVVPEPGLSTDIAPVALMMAKLSLIELTEGASSPAFDSLREDLVASWYFWLNRREQGTPFQDWPPLHDRLDGVGVLRWSGQFLDREPNCPACGTLNIDAAPEDVAAFAPDHY